MLSTEDDMAKKWWRHKNWFLEFIGFEWNNQKEQDENCPCAKNQLVRANWRSDISNTDDLIRILAWINCRFCLAILKHANLGKWNTVFYNHLLRCKKCTWLESHPLRSSIIRIYMELLEHNVACISQPICSNKLIVSK